MKQVITITTLLLCMSTTPQTNAQTTIFEESKGAKTATYFETIDFYRALVVKYPKLKMEEAGPTDTEYPLHVIYYNNSGNYDIAAWNKAGNLILFINNGIHPGEPDGIDASMMLLRDVANGKIKIPDNIMLAVVPVLNIGGMLNRNSHSRANQNGPEAYGFRGNAQYYDLNRDFMKMDAQETRSFVKLYHKLDPDVFVDNHVSNGADYQHVMTLLTTLHDKLGGNMGRYLNSTFEPLLYKDMKQRGYDLVPYVNHWGDTPDKGWTSFQETPRFTSGFTTLFQTYGFVPETHMLKSYTDRVASTYALMESFIKVASDNAEAIKTTRKQDKEHLLQAKTLTIEWTPDTSKKTMITFMGYEAAYKPSEVSGLPRLYYDRSKPYTKQVPIIDNYVAKQTVAVPQAYVIPQGWGRVIERLKDNNVQMQQLEADKEMELGVYYIDGMETPANPFEGHYLHKNVKVRKENRKIKLLKGDYIINLNQPAKRYLVEALEPTAPDAFFAWGFFDAILQQKEHFSAYVFEDEAAMILKNDPKLRQQLENKKQQDPAFAKDAEAQLEFVYHHSPYYEPGHMRYPVYRVE